MGTCPGASPPRKIGGGAARLDAAAEDPFRSPIRSPDAEVRGRWFLRRPSSSVAPGAAAGGPSPKGVPRAAVVSSGDGSPRGAGAATAFEPDGSPSAAGDGAPGGAGKRGSREGGATPWRNRPGSLEGQGRSVAAVSKARRCGPNLMVQTTTTAATREMTIPSATAPPRPVSGTASIRVVSAKSGRRAERTAAFGTSPVSLKRAFTDDITSRVSSGIDGTVAEVTRGRGLSGVLRRSREGEGEAASAAMARGAATRRTSVGR